MEIVNIARLEHNLIISPMKFYDKTFYDDVPPSITYRRTGA